MCSRLARFVRKSRGANVKQERQSTSSGSTVSARSCSRLYAQRSHRILELLPLGGRPLALLRLPFALLRLSLVLQSLQKVESSTT